MNTPWTAGFVSTSRLAIRGPGRSWAIRGGWRRAGKCRWWTRRCICYWNWRDTSLPPYCRHGNARCRALQNNHPHHHLIVETVFELLMAISFSSHSARDVAARGAGVTAVLGPTNTGKTHLAIERMLAHSSGMIGLPLRLLAREVYNKCVDRVGADAVALITGEEKIKPPNARFWVSTVEAMPRDLDVAFVAIDEIQLAADLERGHVFTDRILNRRGREETLVLGAQTMRAMIEKLLPGANILSRPRLSTLNFSGERKLTRLPRRSAIVAFSAEEVYAIAELIRRQRGGAAVVLGALSPRTRNAQVALYQSG